MDGQKGGEQYIRNQNILSDLENITLSTDSNNPTIMQYDGILYTSPIGGSGYEWNAFINGVDVGHNSIGGNGRIGITVVFKKGDSIYATRLNNPCKVCYYKLRDYSNR